MSLTAGTRLGPYEITSALGAGGMGEVYRARDPRLGRDVAIKVMSGVMRRDTNPGALRRFEQEARAAAALSHPNILSIFDVGVGETPFLVTELLEGETLRSLIDRGPLPVSRVVDFGLQIVAGLAAAHAQGIVHRDLKPDNIFVTADSRLKVLDFGLAKQVAPLDDDGSTIAEQTMRGVMLGTLGYMAPEQVRGHDVDHRADIFATGTILFEMLTGSRAFKGESPADTISATLNDPPSRLAFAADTPPSLARIVRRCVEKQGGDRFQSARDLGFALESMSDVRSVPAELTAPSDHTSIAVLPFANLSADRGNQYFSDGLAEDLINALTKLSEEAIALAEQVVARSRAPIYRGVRGMAYGCAGRIGDARRLLYELDERRGRGEYIVPAAQLSVPLGLRDIARIRESLAECAGGGAAPLSVAATNRSLFEACRRDPEIDRLLDDLLDVRVRTLIVTAECRQS